MEIINNTRQVTARKNHKCDYCGLDIKKGEKYEVTTLKNDDGIYDWKNHISCHETATALDMFDFCNEEGLTKEDFTDFVSSKYYDYEENKNNFPDFSEQLEFVKKKFLPNKQFLPFSF